MILNQLEVSRTKQIFTDKFGGYRNAKRVSDGEFTVLQNFTGDDSPVLSTRNKRFQLRPKNGTAPKLYNCLGMARKNSLVYVDVETKSGITAGHLYYNETDLYNKNGFSLDPNTEKQIVSMGTYLIVFPDMKYINTALPNTDRGEINVRYVNSASVRVTLCTSDGKDYQKTSSSSARYVSVSGTAPSSPKDGAMWLDTSESPAMLKKWYDASSSWLDSPSYIKLSCSLIGNNFEQGDSVEITVGQSADADIAALAGTRELVKCASGYVVFDGCMSDVSKTVSTASMFTLKREAPEMDFIVECSNRLWGCKHGVTADGKTVNEIYCSKLGNFKNWKSFSGISTDSWAGCVGTDGDFTGAYSFQGHPIFFKEECFHKIYISDEGAHRIVTNTCRGVEAGSARSLANVDSVLFYKSTDGIYAYDGSNPVKVSSALGKEKYSSAIGAAAGQKYYVSMDNEASQTIFFVFDTVKNAWYTEKCMRTASDISTVKYMAEKNGCIYYVDTDEYMWCAAGTPEGVTVNTGFDETLTWRAETGWFGYEYAERKYISRISFRLYMAQGAAVSFYIKYDDESEYTFAGTASAGSGGTVNIPIIPKRCERMKIKLEGQGECSLYSVSKAVEKGSEL